MKRQLLILFALFFTSLKSFSQDILVNRFYNSGISDGTSDLVELIVVKDSLDIRNWIIKDYANGTISLEDAGAAFRFKNIDLWKNLRAGTVIVLTKLDNTNLGSYTPVLGVNGVIDLGINDANYLTDLNSKSFNLTLHEAVLIRKDDGTGAWQGQENSVHALGYGDFFSRETWGSISSPKSLYNIGVFGASSWGNATIGAVSLKYEDLQTYLTPFDVNSPLELFPSYWNKRTDLMSSWPYGAEVYQMTSETDVVNLEKNIYCVVFNPKLLELKLGYSVSPQKTLQKFIIDEPGTILAGLNGTFFSGSSALGFVKDRGKKYVDALLTLTRDSKTYAVTRAAFGLSPDFVPSVEWIYPHKYTPYSGGGTAYTTPYYYTAPLAQVKGTEPLPAPLQSNGLLWHVSTAIGGSPMLVKNGVINVTDINELVEVDNNSQRARTAIGYTANGNVIMLAAEGGNSATGVYGLTLNQLAIIMKDMGCIGAVNLDGGGSTSLRVNNEVTVRPSENGNERIMPAVLMLKTRN